jgi:CheY-like chemotaxis protein
MNEKSTGFASGRVEIWRTVFQRYLVLLLYDVRRMAPMPGRILFVEDDDDARYAMARLLTREGYHVLAAASCREAIAMAHGQPVDLLIADLDLPDGSGLALLNEIRRANPHPVKGIVVSGHDVEEESRRAGYCAHVVKPIDFGKFCVLITETMNGIAQNR